MIKRLMVVSDIDKVVNIYTDANTFAEPKDIKKWTLEGLAKYPQYNYVFEHNTQIIAAISAIRKRAGIIEINDIAVQRDKRDQGVGTDLLRFFLNKVSDTNPNKIILWVHWKNAAAIPFYYRFNFRLKRLLKTRNLSGVPDGEDIVYLEKVFSHQPSPR